MVGGQSRDSCFWSLLHPLHTGVRCGPCGRIHRAINLLHYLGHRPYLPPPCLLWIKIYFVSLETAWICWLDEREKRKENVTVIIGLLALISWGLCRLERNSHPLCWKFPVSSPQGGSPLGEVSPSFSADLCLFFNKVTWTLTTPKRSLHTPRLILLDGGWHSKTSSKLNNGALVLSRRSANCSLQAKSRHCLTLHRPGA